MLMVDLMRQTLKRSKPKETLIKMTRVGAEACFDARPLYGPDGKWLTKEERGEDCQLPHVQRMMCERKHRHQAGCWRRVHAVVEVDGILFETADGFRAKIFADAQAPTGIKFEKNKHLKHCAAMKPVGED